MQKMPFVKAIILGELTDDAEVYRWLSDDLKFKTETNDNFLTGLRGGINILFTDFKNQFSKLGECNNFKIAVMYDQYFVKKVQIGQNILMTVISETATVDMGQLDLLIAEFTSNFELVDKHIATIDTQ